MKIVTAGSTFLDIDAYAGCIAYAELLNLQSYGAVAYSSATLNESITKTVRSWDSPLVSDYTPDPNDTFILIDVSDPRHLDKAVDIIRVEEVIDHHPGHEDFWIQKGVKKVDIEFIGAACTQIYEAWSRAGLFDEMSQLSARLLVCGILDNTLNFKAGITTDRDQAAYNKLLEVAKLPSDWTETYFNECQQAIVNDLEGALVNDTKVMAFASMDADSIVVGQIVVWDAGQLIDNARSHIERIMATQSAVWFTNIVSIAEGRSYFMASSEEIKSWIETILEVRFSGQVARANRLWLRKEIAKKDRDYSV